jgi:hypothetical protein
MDVRDMKFPRVKNALVKIVAVLRQEHATFDRL